MNSGRSEILVTGSSGFIGSWLMPSLAQAGVRACGLDVNPPAPGASLYEYFEADIRRIQDLALPSGVKPRAVVHLAAVGEVLIPFERSFELYETNLLGAWNVLSTLDPPRFIFASSSSVYGNAWEPAPATWDQVSPVGSYGMSKACGELLCRDWTAGQSGRSAISLRLANVVGPGCRGLLRYLAEHAVRYPDGREPARLRGAGKLVRDYVPVGTVVSAMVQCCRKEFTGGAVTFNICSGMGLSNGDVVDLVRPEIESAGLRLRVQWSDDPGLGEAHGVILDTCGMESLGVKPPSMTVICDTLRASVRAAIAASAERSRCAS